MYAELKRWRSRIMHGPETFAYNPKSFFGLLCVSSVSCGMCYKTHYDSSQVELFLVMFRFLDCIGMTACCMGF